MSTTLISMIPVRVPLAYIFRHMPAGGITGIRTAITIGIVLQALLLPMMYWSGG